MKTKIRAIITKLRGIEDDLIDLLGDTGDTNQPQVKQTAVVPQSFAKDPFHEMSEALEKASKAVGQTVRIPRATVRNEAGDIIKTIESITGRPIKFSKDGIIQETEIPILDEERIDTGFNLDLEDAKAIPHIPQVEDLAAAIGTKDHPAWFKKQKADLEARITPHNWLTEPILTDSIKQLSTEELEAQIAKVIHLKEIAAQHGFVRSTQKGKPKSNNSKDVGGPVKPPKPVARMAPKTSDLKGG